MNETDSDFEADITELGLMYLVWVASQCHFKYSTV